MLLIDAYNVLHLPEAVRDGRAMDLAELAGLIGQSRYAGQRAVLVCDGVGEASVGRGRPQVRVSGVEVTFSGSGSSADDEIEERLQRAGGHRVMVVSDDRRLRRAAGRAGARSLSSRVFLGHLLGDHAKPKTPPDPGFTRDIPLDRYSVAHWMRAFGVSPNGLLDRRAGQAAALPRADGTQPAPKPGPRPEQKPEPDKKPQARSKAPHRPAADTRGEGAPTPPPAKMPDERVLKLESLADDPVIREALDAWQGRLTLEDLDMARWLGEHPPPDDRRG